MQTKFLGFIQLLIAAVPAFTSTTKAETAAQMPLPQLVANRFGKLFLAEEKLVNAAANGETADCKNLSGDDKNIRGDLLSWLCTNPQAIAQLTYRGISVVGAEIVKEVDLEWAKISFPIIASDCVFKDGIDLENSHVAFLNLTNSIVTELNASDAHFEGGVYLDRAVVTDGVRFVGAKIDGVLDCAGGQFVGNDKVLALNAAGVKVEASVLLSHGFKAEGGVSLIGAKISGNLECEGGQFVGNDKVLALNADSAKIEASVLLSDGFKAERGVSLIGAKIGGNLECEDGQFVGNDKVLALEAKRAEISGSVLLSEPFKAEGGVSLVGAKIDGFLYCAGGQFVGNDKVLALNAYSVKIEAIVFLSHGFKATGGVNLESAKIGGNLECEGGQFVGNDKVLALNADSAKIEASVLLSDGFKAERGVHLESAKIGGDLKCEGGQFVGNDKVLALVAKSAEINKNVFLSEPFRAEGGVNLLDAKIDGYLYCAGGQFVGNDKVLALEAGGAQVKGHVFLDGRFEGGVDLMRAKIDNDLRCGGGQFIGNDKVPGLDANGAEVKGHVFLNYGFKAEGGVDLESAKIDGNLECERGQFISKGAWPALDLRLAKVGMLLNAKSGWPIRGGLRVNGFVYDQIAESAFPSAKVQLRWLRLQPRKEFFLSQPFEQLASVLRKMGLEEDARDVMIAKNEEHAHYVQWRPEWLWYGFFGQLIGYGYSPWRAFGISFIMIAIGWWLFRRGYRRGLVTPTGDVDYTVDKDGVHPSSADYPKFNAFVYSLETFVPLVKLGMDEHWTPNANRNALGSGNKLRFPPKTGGWLRGYLWFHIIAGWVLSALWVGGITGLVKT